MLLCLWVAAIMWRFLELCEPPRGGVDQEIESLCKVVGVRERAYQWAWALSLVSVIMMTGLVLAKLRVAWSS